MFTRYLVKPDNIHKGKFVTDSKIPRPSDEQILLEISQFAFTANNVTYAVVGERMGYWQFFPVNKAGWGIIPVWGFATVRESNHPEIQEGERVYGYLPMATHLIVTPGKVNPHGFTDMADHRQSLSPIYNTYVRADTTPGFEQESEAMNALLRPMFTTSFLLDDFFGDKSLFGANTIILSSASSKTAYGTAFLLDANRSERPDYTIIGLTSPSNLPFVKSLNCYDRVLSYDKAGDMDASQTAVYIDFSGNHALRVTLHEHFQDNLVFDSGVGVTHFDKMGSAKGLPGAEAKMFFAPAQLEKRLKDWGRTQYQESMTRAWLAFTAKSQDWIDVTPIAGQDAIADFYQEILAGAIDPQKGYMLTF